MYVWPGFYFIIWYLLKYVSEHSRFVCLTLYSFQVNGASVCSLTSKIFGSVDTQHERAIILLDGRQTSSLRDRREFRVFYPGQHMKGVHLCPDCHSWRRAFFQCSK